MEVSLPGGGAASVSGQQPDISDLRRSLDEVDSSIVGLIAQRSRVIAEIARLKEHRTSAIQDADRERQVLAGVEAVAADLGVSVGRAWAAHTSYPDRSSRARRDVSSDPERDTSCRAWGDTSGAAEVPAFVLAAGGAGPALGRRRVPVASGGT